MFSSSSNRISLPWTNIDTFTFGKSSLYGYDSLNHCLIVHSPIKTNNTNEFSTHQLYLSSSPTWSIRKLILNPDETILALIANKIAYLVYLPQSNFDDASKNSSSEGFHVCQIARVSSLSSPSKSQTSFLIDFVWLTSNHFVTAYSVLSGSQCYLYNIRAKKHDGIELIQTLPVGSLPLNKFGTPSKKISLHQSSDIIKLDVAKRKQNDFILILLFAMKSDGDLFVLEIDENHLLSNQNNIFGEFQGPICILPSTFDNYGVDHGQSTFICLSNSNYPILIYTRDKNQLNQCIMLSPSEKQNYLFSIDSISFSKNENQQIITSIIPDRYSSNRYFVLDSSANLYSIEIQWIDQIQQGVKQFRPTQIQHLIDGTNSKSQIQHIGLIQTNNDQQCLALIIKSQKDQTKELILINSKSFEPIEKTLSAKSRLSSHFIDHIRSLLLRDQSIPYLTLSTSTANISDIDFEKNLLQYINLLNEQFIKKQDRVHQVLKNKQNHLSSIQQTQFNEYQQLIKRLAKISQQFKTLSDQYREEHSHRERLSTHTDDLLSIIEQNTPVLSEAEIRMQQQLTTYHTQIVCLTEKVKPIQQFISPSQNQGQWNNSSIESIQNMIRNYQKQIEQMKKQLETVQNS